MAAPLNVTTTAMSGKFLMVNFPLVSFVVVAHLPPTIEQVPQ